jgi:hypothetical protein
MPVKKQMVSLAGVLGVCLFAACGGSPEGGQTKTDAQALTTNFGDVVATSTSSNGVIETALTDEDGHPLAQMSWNTETTEVQAHVPGVLLRPFPFTGVNAPGVMATANSLLEMVWSQVTHYLKEAGRADRPDLVKALSGVRGEWDCCVEQECDSYYAGNCTYWCAETVCGSECPDSL